MSLVRKSYRRNDDEDEEAAVETYYVPPKKKAKSCAPENETPPPPVQIAAWDPFVPLQIIQPTVPQHPARTSARPVQAERAAPAPLPVAAPQSLNSFAIWSAADVEQHGTLRSQPSTIELAVASTLKKGRKAAKRAQHLLWTSSTSAGGPVPVSRVQWDHVSGSLLATSSMDGCVKLWDVLRTPGRQVQTFQVVGGVRDVQFNADGRDLIFGGFGRTLYQFDIDYGKVKLKVPQEADIMNVHETSDGLLVFSLASGSILTLDPRDPHVNAGLTTYAPLKTTKDAGGRFVRRICDLPGPVTSFAFLTESTVSVTCDPSNRSASEYAVSVWDWESGRALATGLWNSPLSAFYAVKHPSLSQFAVLTASNTVQAFAAHEPFRIKKKKSFQFETGKALSSHRSQLSISPDGSLLYVGTASGAVYSFNYETMSQGGTLKPFGSNPISAVAHHPILHSHLAIASWNGEVSVYA